ncbi:acyltransferase family protein (plasmid) [Streptomyces sp. BHT-5-2]|uniref:acyltransferase family protein n=1 Tax=unclassified Streptomyces TaxID=2593676 RepID=UPI001C8E8C65|nr:acyltransferase family protein [Streptomyces sp. BHT-5-2]QZL07761.1 acyltransferase family protein [Streptomyces sp. BHT-5-2]
MAHDLGRTTAPADTAGPGRPRLHYVDNLRITLTVLVVLHHTAVTYGDIPLWYYTEPAKDGSGLLLDAFVMINQAFFMGFFFMIAGYFTPPSYDRKGPGPFLRDRLRRLGIPLLAFLLVLRPLSGIDAYLQLKSTMAERGQALPYWFYYLASWDPGPLWFVEVLLAFALVYALVRFRAARRTQAAPVEAAPSRPTPQPQRPLRPRSIIVFTVCLALATYAWRILVPSDVYVPVLGLPTPSFLPQYASFFVLGVLAHRRGWAQTLSRRTGRLGFVVAGVATLAYLPILTTAASGTVDGNGTWQSLAAATWESTFAVSIVVGLTVLFRERLNHQGPKAAFLSRHAFAVYLLHAPVLVGLGLAFRWLHAPAAVKFALVGALALPLCWTVAYAVRRLPRADRVL